MKMIDTILKLSEVRSNGETLFIIISPNDLKEELLNRKKAIEYIKLKYDVNRIKIQYIDTKEENNIDIFDRIENLKQINFIGGQNGL